MPVFPNLFSPCPRFWDFPCATRTALASQVVALQGLLGVFYGVWNMHGGLWCIGSLSIVATVDFFGNLCRSGFSVGMDQIDWPLVPHTVLRVLSLTGT